jgi:N-methyl-L-proline demethylase
MKNDPLLQPFQLKHLRLKNRVMLTSHEPAYSEDGLPKDRYRLYHVERAKGGVALTMTAGSAIVAPDSPPVFGNLHAYRDEIVPWLMRLADDCHEHGAAVMIQLTHLGRRTRWNTGDWLPVLSASPLREPAHRSFPKAAEAWDLDRIAAQYASAAQRMQAAGLDGFELEAYGHLLDGFWSPATNHRDDEHNGSLDNRLRFTRRVLDAIRKAVGREFIVGIRLVADEQWDKGLSREEGVGIAQRLVDDGQIDFLNIIRGHIDTDAALTKVIPIQGMASAPHLDFAGEVRAATRFPVFHGARIGDVATARHAIAEGKLDMVGMTRAHIADPHIVLKIAQGREHEIRPCVGATYCLDRIYENGEALCIHNASSGREATMPHEVPRSTGPKRKVVIIGAGPAGLEAARVAGERGHEVVVFEAADEPGGQVRLASRTKRRAEMIGIVDWRVGRLEALGVALRCNVFADAQTVLAENPDVVIIATGGLPNTAFLDAGSEFVTPSWDILSGDAKIGSDVLLFDDNGGYPGMQAAEVIALAGSKLEVVSPERFFAPEMGGMNHVPYAQVFQQHGVVITINRRLVAVQREGTKLAAIIGSDFGPWRETRLVDQVVVEHGTLPLDELYFELKPGSVNGGEIDQRAMIDLTPQTVERNPQGRYRLWRIGDAVASRNIHASIYEAMRLTLPL